MIVIGLTGSIGMGKSTAAHMLRQLKLPVHDADAVVHALLGPRGRAVPAVLAAFPGTAGHDSNIDRKVLGRRVFGDSVALHRLERLLHPLVAAEERRFIASCARRRAPIVIRDVPLLYETGGDRRCAAVMVVSAPLFLQRQRVLARPGMTETQFRQILAKQLPDREKRRRTPYIVETSLGKRHSLKMLCRFLKMIAAQSSYGGIFHHARYHLRHRNYRPRPG
jgi:dephospho-CoA kinase